MAWHGMHCMAWHGMAWRESVAWYVWHHLWHGMSFPGTAFHCMALHNVLGARRSCAPMQGAHAGAHGEPVPMVGV
eukprot:111652-Chlamydomonas_euryale.AAC.4